MGDPIAYTYEADYHCPDCAVARFGTDDNGYPPETATDGEGNPVGAVFPWDEWSNDDAGAQTLACGTCGAVLDEYGPVDEPDRPAEDDDYITDARAGYRVTSAGAHVGTFSSERRAAAALYLERQCSSYWPNVWRVNERGNMTLCVFDGHILRATETGWV